MVWIRIGVPILMFWRRVSSQITRSAISSGEKILRTGIPEVVWQIASDFDLAPANIQLAAFEQVFAGREGREKRLGPALARKITLASRAISSSSTGMGMPTPTKSDIPYL